MAQVKMSSKVEEKPWNDLREYARESHQSISGLLTEAIEDLLRRKRVRPEVLLHLDRSLQRNDDLGRRLGR